MQSISFFTLISLSILSLVSCKKDRELSTPLEFKSSDVYVESFLDQAYLKVIDGSNYTYYYNAIPDTLGYATDTTNKFKDINGNVVDTLWITKAYVVFPDTIQEGFHTVYIPVDKYNLGHYAPPFSFNYIVAKTISNSGVLDISGSYKRNGGATIVNIDKISQGNFVLDNAYNAPVLEPAMIYVKDASNTIEFPKSLTGFFNGSNGAISIREAFFYDIRYALKNSVQGTGDTLYYKYRRVGASAPVSFKLIRL